MRLNRREDFEAGLSVVRPFFDMRGFALSLDDPWRENEGISYLARFTAGIRAVTLHHMYSLGPVLYWMGESYVEHSRYLEALGVKREAAYPAFVDDSISGYPALLSDLEHLLTPYFEGSEDDFMEIASRVGGVEPSVRA